MGSSFKYYKEINKNQRSEHQHHRSRRPEIRSQSADQKRLGVDQHASEHFPDRRAFLGELPMEAFSQKSAVLRKIQPSVRLTILPISISQFTDEMSFISALRPRLTKICAD